MGQHLKGLRQCCGSIVLQSVPACDEHLQLQGGAERTRLLMTHRQSRRQDLEKQVTPNFQRNKLEI